MFDVDLLDRDGVGVHGFGVETASAVVGGEETVGGYGQCQQK